MTSSQPYVILEMSERSLIGTLLKTLTTELNLMRINSTFYEKKVNASLILEKGGKKNS